jgi:bifunctional DNase/RNase
MLIRRAALFAPFCVLLLGASSPDSKKDAPKAPEGFVEIFVVGVIPGDDGNTVILTDAMRERFVPMGIGNTEALSIHTRLERRRFARPLTHDLFDSVLRELGGKLVKVQIDDLRDDIFLGTVFVQRKGRVLRFDARPSDAIALALGSKVPIFMKATVLDKASFRPEDLPDDDEPTVPASTNEPTYTL